MKRLAVSFSLLVIVAALTSCGKPVAQSKKYAIAVIPKGTTNEFWNTVHAGAVKAEQELRAQGIDVSIIWKGPFREDDREQQIQVVEGFLSQGVSGIVLAPLDRRALVRPVEEATRAGIPTVIFDSALDSADAVSFVATDNVKGGHLAADRIGSLLQGKGKIILLRYQEGSASTYDREEGFLSRIKSAYPGIEVISSDQYAGPTRDTAKRAAENLLNRYGGEVRAIFCPQEASTSGMLLALQDLGKAGQIILIGFDGTQAFVHAIRKKQMHGFVLQNPFNIGYLGVKTMLEHLQGKHVEKRIDTGVIVVTPDNLRSEEHTSELQSQR